MKLVKVKSLRALTKQEEEMIYEIVKSYGYRYWGGGSVMVDSDGVSCLNIGFETRAATISTKLGTQLRKLFGVEEVRVEGVKL
jgi:vacuolar-type H+-ATPase subunit E/Vma4